MCVRRGHASQVGHGHAEHRSPVSDAKKRARNEFHCSVTSLSPSSLLINTGDPKPNKVVKDPMADNGYPRHTSNYSEVTLPAQTDFEGEFTAPLPHEALSLDPRTLKRGLQRVAEQSHGADERQVANRPRGRLLLRKLGRGRGLCQVS